MDPTDEPHGRAPPDGDAADRGPGGARAQARLDRRAEALRANLKRRKAQTRGRAAAEEPAPARD